MPYVILIILGLVILMLGLNFFEDNEIPVKEKPKTEIVLETKEDLKDKGFLPIEKPKELDIKKEVEIEVKKEEPVLLTQDKTPEFIVHPGFFVSVKDWKLGGQQKNILTVVFDVNNGLNESIKNERKVISCQAYYNEELLETVEVIHNFNIRRLSITKLELNFGYVDIDTNKIVCVMEDFIESEPTVVKPMEKKEEVKAEVVDVYKDEPIYKERIKEVREDGFIKKEIVKEEGDILLPPL